MPTEPSLYCRVCGRYEGEDPWGPDLRSPTFEICECCGCEFGYHDATPKGIAAQRERWIAGGCAWRDPDARPDGWDATTQLRNASGLGVE